MTNLDTPDATEVLRSLRLVRSSDPEERKRGVAVLSTLLDDPRVLQVFEYLYEKDPDPGVRDLAWRAINQRGPSIPAPASNNHRTPSPAFFLLNPANVGFVAKEMRKLTQQKRTGGLTAFALAGVLLLVAGLFWGLVLPDWSTWYRLRQDGVTIRGEVDELRASGDNYYVFYRFFTSAHDTETDVPYPGQQCVSKSDFDALSEGDPVVVTYLSDDPTVSRLDQANPDDFTRNWQTGVAGGATMLLVVLLAVGSVQRQRPARARGKRLIRGQIVACNGTMDDDGDFILKVRYRFRTPTGRTLTSQTSQIRNDLKMATLPPAGTPVAVYYRSDRSFVLL
jgi:hypothetical protein